MSDVLTLKGDYGTMQNSYLFYLYQDGQSASKWMFFLFAGKKALRTFGVYTSDEIKYFDQTKGSEIKVQIFHDKLSDALNVVTPKSTFKSNNALNIILKFNVIEIIFPRNFALYDYVSICRPQEPIIQLTVPTQPYTLGSTVTLQCTITGPPFLSGYWTKDSTAVTSSERTELQSALDESEAEHRLELQLILSRFHVDHQGLYGCHAASSIMAPNKTIDQSIEITYSAPVNITEPTSRTYNLLPKSFTWRVEGYPINGVVLECSAGEITRDQENGTMNKTAALLFNVTVGRGWEGEQFNCRLKKDGEMLGTFLFSK